MPRAQGRSRAVLHNVSDTCEQINAYPLLPQIRGQAAAVSRDTGRNTGQHQFGHLGPLCVFFEDMILQEVLSFRI
jgi:hypothetical protein